MCEMKQVQNGEMVQGRNRFWVGACSSNSLIKEVVKRSKKVTKKE